MNRLFFPGSFTIFFLLPFIICALYFKGLTPIQLMEYTLRQKIAELQTPDDLQRAAHGWYERPDLANVAAMDRALEKVLPEALKEAPSVTDFQTWEGAQKYKAYHDAGAVLMARSYTLLYYGQSDKALAGVRLLMEKLPYSMMLEANGTVRWTRDAVRYHEHMCALYAAIIARQVKTVVFPPERDEFDGPAQRLACRHMAVLRLKEGNYDAVERWAEMAATQKLRTCSGDWVIGLIYDSMEPWEGDLDSEAAWSGIGRAIKAWQARMPGSAHAKLAEASFLSHWAAHATKSQGEYGAADFQDRSERGLRLMGSLKPDSPAWYATTLVLMGQTKADPKDMARVFNEGIEKYPDYSRLADVWCSDLARSGDGGAEACAAVIHQMVKEGHEAPAARVLWWLCSFGDLATVQARLDAADVRAAIKAALAAWPAGLELHSDLGYMAVTLDQKDLARQAMQGLAGRWNRTTWKDREDLAMQLAGQPSQP